MRIKLRAHAWQAVSACSSHASNYSVLDLKAILNPSPAPAPAPAPAAMPDDTLNMSFYKGLDEEALGEALEGLLKGALNELPEDGEAAEKPVNKLAYKAAYKPADKPADNLAC